MTPAPDSTSTRPWKWCAHLLSFPLLIIGIVSVPFNAQAQDGTWTLLASGDASGLWTDPANWSGGTVPGGSGFTADFGTLNVVNDSTVTLGSAVTLGNLIFGDTNTSSAASWTLSNGGTTANTLTLAGATPTITVNALGAGKLAAISAIITGTDGLTKGGAGTLVLSGANTYTGGTTVNAGTLSISETNALASGSIAIASGASLKLSKLNGAYTLSDTITGSGTLHLNNINGSTTITGNNSGFSGLIRVERSTLVIGSDNALGTGSILLGVNDQGSSIRASDTTGRTITGAFSLTGTAGSSYNFGSGTAAVNGNLVFTNTTAVALGSVTRKFQVYNRTQFDAGFTGSTGITLQTAGGTLVLNGSNSYTGTTTINAGVLQIGNGGTTGSLSAASAIVNNSNLTINRSNAVTQGIDFSSGISGTGSFTQAGSGTTTLTGINTYTGVTTVAAGTLIVNGSLATSSAVTVNNTGTLAGSGTIGGTVALASGATISPGNSPGMLTTGAQTWSGGAAYNWQVLDFNGTMGTSAGYDLIAISGALDLAGLSAGSPFTVNLLSLASTGPDVSGDAANFNNAINGSWTLVTTTGGITGYGVDASVVGSLFNVNTSGFSNDLAGGAFTVGISGNDLVLNFTAVSAIPEPSTYAAIAGALALGAVVLRRRRQRAQA